MRHVLLTISLIFIGFNAFVQDYFQQSVNYKIDVNLDDKNHILRGFEVFSYVNNSPNTLNEIYIHLWPNAYKNGNTALANQLYRQGDKSLKYGKEEDKGYIDSLDFKVNGKAVKLVFDEEHIDIAKIILNEALPSGEQIEVTTPFKVKIPNASISRLGHVDESYMITQWYPKPAVYDKNGWNTMPYLGQGEFYSEYGSFDVSITLPKNYVVGATGDLQNPREYAFLERRAKETAKRIEDGVYEKRIRSKKVMDSVNVYPESDKTMKTVRYKQSNVHDFAWFADKRFEVLISEVELPNSKKKVTSYAMFTPKNGYLWKNASEYLNDAVYYYSKWNGDYPYKQVTAIDGTIAAGGGMEYPNVTVIGNMGSAESLEIVIVHEVGHNWFYGQLGSNERMHAWMDEGLNTLNEVRYIQTKYPNNTRLADALLEGKFNFHGKDYHDQNDVLVRTASAFGLDQPLEMHSDDFTSINYGIMVYQKTGLIFDYLKSYLGEEKFDQCMRAYYDKWEFKHPQPEDIEAVFEEKTGENLDWFFKDLIQTTNKIDYKIKNVKQEGENTLVEVKNVGQVDGPIPVTLITQKGDTITQWIKAATADKTLTFKNAKVAQAVIDLDNQIPELNRTNNNYNTDWLLNRVEPLKINPIISYNRQEQSNVSVLPALGVNEYDKFMLGLSFHNFHVSGNKLQYLLAPMYSFGRKMVSGTGEIFYTLLPKQNFESIKLGASLKSFKDDDTFRDNDSYFAGVNPYINMELGTRGPRSAWSQNVLLQGLLKTTKRGTTMNEAGGFGQYRVKYNKPDTKIEVKTRVEYILSSLDDEMGRASLEGEYRYKYLKNKKESWLEIRAFAGFNFLNEINSVFNANRYVYALGGQNGAQDLYLEEYYFGRNQTAGIWAQQRSENMGGLKTVSNYGNTTTWLTTANAYLQLPVLNGMFGVYGDVGATDQNGTVYGVYDAGIGMRVGGLLNVYFPVLQSQNLEDSFISKAYEQRIRFTLNLNLVNSGKLLDVFKR
ncbi:MAG: M1 family metallopeptidase [Lishizhenia sp.]